MGFVLWLTGLSGAGKSTLAVAVAANLRQRGRTVEVLDGDVLRQNLSERLGFSREDRDAHVLRVASKAAVLARNGVVAIVAMISPYRATRKQARQLCDRFVEVHVATPLEVCLRRDPKGLYARALRGEIPQFTGISDPYEEPLSPELRIDSGDVSVEVAVERILAVIEAAP
jgi:adenylyl-sulfate kinase